MGDRRRLAARDRARRTRRPSPRSSACDVVKLTARVPATSANLGPGFDCFGLALDLWNDVTVDTDARAGRDVGGAGCR